MRGIGWLRAEGITVDYRQGELESHTAYKLPTGSSAPPFARLSEHEQETKPVGHRFGEINNMQSFPSALGWYPLNPSL